MDKSLEEIRNEAIAKKDELLPELNNPSIVSIWYTLCDLMANVIKTFQDIFNDERVQFEEEIQRNRYGKENWYAQEVMKFQYGDDLQWDKEKAIYYYDAIDLDKQIVKKVSVRGDSEGTLLFKVAKLVNGELAPLDPPELIALDAYIKDDIIVAGTNYSLLSQNGDIIDAEAEVFYDGAYKVADIQTAVEAALEEFRNGIDESGVVLRHDLVRKLRAVPGVYDVYFSYLSGRAHGQQAENIEREYLLSAGYFNFPNAMVDNWEFTPQSA